MIPKEEATSSTDYSVERVQVVLVAWRRWGSVRSVIVWAKHLDEDS